MTVTFLKITGQLFCRRFFNLGLSLSFLMIKFRFCIFDRYVYYRSDAVLFASYLEAQDFNLPLTDHSHFDLPGFSAVNLNILSYNY